ncbi:MAG: hypothetical protein DMF95_06800 [Acidobacteria bacterium]|nr:MAG: hypothetical protein DMF95_06800 [Acidobacteriota bacterium]
MDRREFLKTAGAAGVASAWPRVAGADQVAATARSDRDAWIAVMRQLADPVLTNLANGTLRARMPVEQAAGGDRRPVTHLEAIGRLLAGLAPWIDLPADDTGEGRLRAEYAALARRAIARAVDPASPDFLNFTRDRQPLVDAAFLALGVLRAPRALRDGLDAATKRHLVAALESTRPIVQGYNNWLLFSATVEAGLKNLGAGWDRLRVDYALRQHEQWYKGDGAYGDGPDFHWDYYNSFVIHPLLLAVVDACKDEATAWKELALPITRRAERYAAIQERFIAPDGSFPAIGRSLAYRCGAFHLLADVALRRSLPEGVSPAQVRGALTSVITRTIDAPGTFDRDGWLQIGLCGHQPGVGETYISTGSLYLCAVGLLPLGLPATDAFWSAPPQPWTSAKAWSGQAFPIDHAVG